MFRPTGSPPLPERLTSKRSTAGTPKAKAPHKAAGTRQPLPGKGIVRHGAATVPTPGTPGVAGGLSVRTEAGPEKSIGKTSKTIQFAVLSPYSLANH